MTDIKEEMKGKKGGRKGRWWWWRRRKWARNRTWRRRKGGWGEKEEEIDEVSPCQMAVNDFIVEIQHCIQCRLASVRQASLMLVPVVPPVQQLSISLLIIDVKLMLKQAGLEISFKPAVPWLPAPDPSAASPRACHMKHSHSRRARSLARSQIQSSCSFNEPGRCCAAAAVLPLISAQAVCLASQNKSTLGFLAPRPNTSEAKRWRSGVVPGSAHFISTPFSVLPWNLGNL